MSTPLIVASVFAHAEVVAALLEARPLVTPPRLATALVIAPSTHPLHAVYYHAAGGGPAAA